MGQESSEWRLLEVRSEGVHATPRGRQSVNSHETDVLVVRPDEGHEVDESDESENDESRDVERLFGRR